MIALSNLLGLIGYCSFLIIVNNNVVDVRVMESMVIFNITKFKCV